VKSTAQAPVRKGKSRSRGKKERKKGRTIGFLKAVKGEVKTRRGIKKKKVERHYSGSRDSMFALVEKGREWPKADYGDRTRWRERIQLG